MHSLGVLHRDLKLDNIFIVDKLKIILGDFGSTKDFKPALETIHTKEDYSHISNESSKNTISEKMNRKCKLTFLT